MELTNGRQIGFPAARFHRLVAATDEQTAMLAGVLLTTSFNGKGFALGRGVTVQAFELCQTGRSLPGHGFL